MHKKCIFTQIIHYFIHLYILLYIYKTYQYSQIYTKIPTSYHKPFDCSVFRCYFHNIPTQQIIHQTVILYKQVWQVWQLPAYFQNYPIHTTPQYIVYIHYNIIKNTLYIVCSIINSTAHSHIIILCHLQRRIMHARRLYERVISILYIVLVLIKYT